jgi:hypothetical protein
VIRLSQRYGNDRVERACEVALKLSVVNYSRIENILKNGRDRIPLQEGKTDSPTMIHDNIRGSKYYH